MDTQISLHYYFNLLFLLYGSMLFLSYLFIGILSSFQLSFYSKRNKFFDFNSIEGYKMLPTISIIAPAYNEEQSIVENIRSLLSVKYPERELIIVNDGSRDGTMDKIVDHYSLVKVNYAYVGVLDTAKIRGVYKSTNAIYSKLIVVDKENGGKADALNAGINISRSDLFLAIDVDCIIEHDAILRMVKPFLEEQEGKRVIASGGVVRVANNCEIKDGRIVGIRFPENLFEKLQVLEYFRAFILGRMAWSKINGLLIISGAFGMFDRKLVLAVGGYDTTSVGEDLELVIRMRKYMHNVEKRPYRVAFIPDPLCWTEVPSTLKVLSRQRNRWTRGLIDSIIKHKDMFLNPRYGKIGMISFPYWVFFEWLAPFIELIGISYFFLMVLFGRINFWYFILFSIFVVSFSMLYSFFAVFYEKYIFRKYKGFKFLSEVIFIPFLEILIYHPMNVFFAISGNYDFFIKRQRKGWGKMNRTGFTEKKQKNEHKQ